MRLSIALATGLTALLAWAAPASAGTVCATGTTAVFAAADVASLCPGATDGPGEANSLIVSTDSAGDIVFTDSVPIADGDGPGGCTATNKTATCPGALAYRFDLGDGDDSAGVGAVANGGLVSTGGDGKDHLTGGPLADVLDGGAGDDTIEAGGGNDTLTGGPGDDRLDGGDDNDSLDGGAGPGTTSDNDVIGGGAGEDTVFYVRPVNVSVSLDDGPGDGQAGESDNVASDVEDVTSGSGNDTLIGSDGRNVLDGGRGADTLSGLPGNDVLIDSGGDKAADTLDGGAGDDTMAAGAGPDVYNGGDGEDTVTDYAARGFPVTVTLDGNADDGASGEGDNVQANVEEVTGGSGDDTLIGNASDNELSGGAGDDTIAGGDGNDGLNGDAGRDTIDGGGGRDDMVGGAGADTLKSRDGLTDRLNCGGGTDAVQGEARDDIAGNCENLSIAPPTAVAIQSVTVTRAGFAVVRIACPVTERSCAGAIIVKTVRRVARRFIKLGQVNYRLRGTQSKVFRARIAARDRKALRRARRVKLRAVVTNVNSDTGDSTNATQLATVTTRGLR
jgi:Ca2+-binding RTX toxin-like protein